MSPDSSPELFAINVWDARRGVCRCQLKGHRAHVSAALFLSDTRLLTCARDNAIYLWDIETGEQLRSFAAHTAGVLGLQTAGNRFWSWGKDGMLRCWDPNCETASYTAQGHTQDIACAQVRGDLAATGAGGQIKLWSMKNAACMNTFTAHPGGVRDVALTADGQRVITCGRADGTACVWTTAGKLTKKGKLPKSTYPSNFTGCIAGGERFALLTPRSAGISSYTKILTVWDIKKGRLGDELEHFDGVVSPNGKLLLGYNANGDNLFLLNAEKRVDKAALQKAIRRLVKPAGKSIMRAKAHSFTLDNGRVFAACYGKQERWLTVWDVKTARVLCQHPLGFEAMGCFLTENPELVLFAAKSQAKGCTDMYLVNITSGKTLGVMKGLYMYTLYQPPLASTLFFNLTQDRHELQLFDMESGECVASQYSEQEFVSGQLSEGGDTLLAGARGGVVYFYKLENGSRARRLKDVH